MLVACSTDLKNCHFPSSPYSRFSWSFNSNKSSCCKCQRTLRLSKVSCVFTVIIPKTFFWTLDKHLSRQWLCIDSTYYRYALFKKSPLFHHNIALPNFLIQKSTFTNCIPAEVRFAYSRYLPSTNIRLITLRLKRCLFLCINNLGWYDSSN